MAGALKPWHAVTGCAGVLACLLYSRTPCYGSHLGAGDRLYGWPLGYATRFSDVIGEFFGLASPSVIAFAADVAIGAAAGLATGLLLTLCLDSIFARFGRALAAHRTVNWLALLLASMAVVTFAARPHPTPTWPMKAEHDIRGILLALKLFNDEQGRYPTTDEGLTILVERNLLDGVPKDPWGHPYSYAFEPQGPLVRSFGADGKPGETGRDMDTDNRMIDAPHPACGP